MLRTGYLEWNLQSLTSAMMLHPDEVTAYFTDGRRISFLLERRLSREVLHGTLAPTEGAGYDIADETGGLWEVRSLTRGGVYFCPSYMVGKGRSFDEAGFKAKLANVKGYIVSDIERFPRIRWWQIPVAYVQTWWAQGKLGTSSKIGQLAAQRLFESAT